MDALVAWLALVTAGGAVVTKSVDLVRNAIDRDNSFPAVTWNVVAFAIGVGYALGWQIDVTATLLDLVPALKGARLDGVAGQILTGLVMGGAAGFWHELFDSLSMKAEPHKVRATTK